MENTNITIRIDKDLKKDANKLFDDLGLNLTTAITIFLKKAVREQKIPFQVSKTDEIRFLDKESLKEFALKETRRHHKAYEELSKWFG